MHKADLMVQHFQISKTALRKQIKQNEICFGGNKKLKIYGKLHCKAGRRMKKENRVLFISENEAIEQGFRPCGYCMNSKYKKWKNGFVR